MLGMDGIVGWTWGSGDAVDPPPSECSTPFTSGTVSSGGGDWAIRFGGGEATIEGDLKPPPMWLERTGLPGPTLSGAMSTRNREPGLDVPEHMDTRSILSNFKCRWGNFPVLNLYCPTKQSKALYNQVVSSTIEVLSTSFLYFFLFISHNVFNSAVLFNRRVGKV